MFLMEPQQNLARHYQIFQVWLRPVQPPPPTLAVRLAIVAVSKNGEELKRQLASEDPSPMTYNSPKPAEITEEDKVVERWPLNLKIEDIVVRPVATVFQ